MLRTALTCALVIFGVVLCQAQSTQQEQHVQLAHSLTEAIVNADFEAMDEVLHEDFMGYGPFISDTLGKKDFISAWKTIWDQQMHSLEFERAATLPHTVKEGPLAGDWVFDWLETQAHYQEKPDKTVKFRVQLTSRIIDGKIRASVMYYNVADIQKQLGYKVVPAQK